MSELVTIEISEGIADVRLNRADKYNALESTNVQRDHRSRGNTRRR